MPAASSPRSSSRPAGPDEGPALAVLDVAGLLAHEHDPGALEPLAEDRLGRRAASRWQPRQPAAASRSAESEGRSGRKGVASLGSEATLACYPETAE